MATTAHSELFCLTAPQTAKPVDVLTCEDMPGDWTGFWSLVDQPSCKPAAAIPVALSRNIQINLDGVSRIVLSRSASIDEIGLILHRGNVRAQMRRAFVNVSELLATAGASWKDVVRATCFLRDVTDAPVFDEELEAFFAWQDNPIPPPSHTAIQAILSRPELLLEIEAVAIVVR